MAESPFVSFKSAVETTVSACVAGPIILLVLLVCFLQVSVSMSYNKSDALSA
nr:hypothetical protein [Sicyoidochytrium minutum DNA virus]